MGFKDNRRFCLKNCPSLKSLRICDYSFQDFTVCEIESVNALESIELGEDTFYYTHGLELKSILIHIK